MVEGAFVSLTSSETYWFQVWADGVFPPDRYTSFSINWATLLVVSPDTSKRPLEADIFGYTSRKRIRLKEGNANIFDSKSALSSVRSEKQHSDCLQLGDMGYIIESRTISYGLVFFEPLFYTSALTVRFLFMSSSVLPVMARDSASALSGWLTYVCALLC